MNIRTESPSIRDVHVDGRHGRLAARIWSPSVDRDLAPIMLMHDSLGSVDLWRGFPLALCQATGRPVIAYDRLGFGRSEPNPHSLTLDFVESEAEHDFAAVARHLGVGRFVVMGHSVGGGMAIHCAARYGENCVAMITEAAQIFVEDKTLAGIEAAREQFKDETQFNRLARYHGDKTRWVLNAWIGSWLNPAFADWSATSVLPRVTSPTLAIHGVDDEYGSPIHARSISTLVSAPVRLEVMDGTMHVPHREREGEVVNLIADFLASLP